MYKHIIVVFIICAKGYHCNKTQNLLSNYAKVAYWGATVTPKMPNEGRSSSGQSLWMHRSDVNVRGGQNIQQENSPIYYDSKQIPNSKLDKATQEILPAKGEIQERFNPRPYFDFVLDDPRQNKKPDATKASTSNNRDKSKPPTVIYGTPADSFQTFDNPPIQTLQLDSKPPIDSYSSPFSSYNPPNDNVKQPSPFDYLPNQQPTNMDMLEDSKVIDSKPSLQENSNGNFHPPLKPPSSFYYGPPPPPETSNSYMIPQIPSIKKPLNEYGPPDTDLYEKPSKEPVQSPDAEYNPPNQDSESDNGPPITATSMPPNDAQPEYLDHLPNDFNHHKKPISMAEGDLSPPPANVPYGNIPQYLDHEPKDHDFYHYTPHQVYHEIKTTSTTTEAPRAAGHYSYYYLGRKLWYIPLYFSVYFIIYVTFLIIKSIARHKIQFSHHFDKVRESRDLNLINETVMTSIDDAKNKYM